VFGGGGGGGGGGVLSFLLAAAKDTAQSDRVKVVIIFRSHRHSIKLEYIDIVI
jgi:hypothetical protein